MSQLSDIIAQLESGGGAANASQPPSMVNPTYGQYSGFTSQYGSGAAGVDNYAQQVLQANPNATLGDFYSGYVLGTGNPASLPGSSVLASNYPGAYNNLVNNAGVPLNTPLTTLLPDSNQLGNTAVVDQSSGLLAGVQNAAFDPMNSLPSMLGPFGAALGYLFQTAPVGSATAPGAPSQNVGLTPGLTNDVTAWLTNNLLNPIKGTFAAAENWAGRGFVIFVGIAILVVALFALTRDEVVQQVRRAVT